MIRACKKSRYVTAQNFEIETIFFRRFYFRFARFYAVFSLPVCCTACVGYSRARLKTLSSLLKGRHLSFQGHQRLFGA